MTLADSLGVIMALLVLPASFAYGHKQAGSRGGLAFLAAIGSHVVLAALSAAGILLPPESDNLEFHRRAIDFLEGWRDLPALGPTSDLWPYVVSYLYAPFGASIWLGYAANQWIFFAALVQLAKFSDEIGAGPRMPLIVLIFSLLPSSLLFANFLLREPFQIWALIFVLRQLEQYRRNGTIRSLVKATAALVPFGAIHNGFFLFAPIALTGAALARMMFAPSESHRRLGPGGSVVVVVVGILVAAGALYAVVNIQEQGRVSRILAGDIDVERTLTEAARRGSRTVLPWAVGSNPAEIVVNSPVLLVQFLFAPVIPFMVRSPQDAVALADTLARLAFIILSCRAYAAASRDRRRMLLYLLGNYLVFCMIAAVGTATLGTAMRHNLKMFWIVIAVGMLPAVRAVPAPRAVLPHPGTRAPSETIATGRGA